MAGLKFVDLILEKSPKRLIKDRRMTTTMTISDVKARFGSVLRRVDKGDTVFLRDSRAGRTYQLLRITQPEPIPARHDMPLDDFDIEAMTAFPPSETFES